LVRTYLAAEDASLQGRKASGALMNDGNADAKQTTAVGKRPQA
jgi:hypothetical protein